MRREVCPPESERDHAAQGHSHMRWMSRRAGPTTRLAMALPPGPEIEGGVGLCVGEYDKDAASGYGALRPVGARRR
jgi:hypothetical protein